MFSIPLSVFVDNTHQQTLKGTIVSNGICSSMKNPLYDTFGDDYIYCDLRTRDNNVIMPMSALSLENGQYVETRTALAEHTRGTEWFLNNNSNYYGTWRFKKNNNGYYLEKKTEPANFQADLHLMSPKDYMNGLYDINYEDRVVILTACRITALGDTNPPIADASGYFENSEGKLLFGGGFLNRCNKNGSEYSYRAYMSNKLGTNNSTYCGFLQSDSWSNAYNTPSTTSGADLITEESLNKWMLLEIVKGYQGDSGTNENDCTMRVLGAQFTQSGNLPAEKIIKGTTTQAASVFGTYRNTITASNHLEVAFSTVVKYSGNLTNGKKGTEIDAFEWLLFEPEQQLNSYNINGNVIAFACTGYVAWEIKVDGYWMNTDGSTGSSNRVFYNTGTHSLRVPTFTAIRPVLKNSGLMNADNNAILHYITTDTYTASHSFLAHEYNFLGRIVYLERATVEYIDHGADVVVPDNPNIDIENEQIVNLQISAIDHSVSSENENTINRGTASGIDLTVTSQQQTPTGAIVNNSDIEEIINNRITVEGGNEPIITSNGVIIDNT